MSTKTKMNTEIRLKNISAEIKKLGKKDKHRDEIELAKLIKAAKAKKMKTRKPKQIIIKGLQVLQGLKGIYGTGLKHDVRSNSRKISGGRNFKS